MSAAESVHPKAEENDEDVKQVLMDLLRKIDQTETTSAVDSQTISINSLPDSLLLMIFSNLSKVADRCSIARTCRLWNRIIKDPALWKRLMMSTRTVDGFEKVKMLLSNGLSHCLLMMDLDLTSVRGLYNKRKFWPSFQNLQRLKLHDIDLSFFDFDLLPSSLRILEIFLPENHDYRFAYRDFRLPWEKRVNCSGPVLPNLKDLQIEDRRTKFQRSAGRGGDIQELHGLHHLLSGGKIEYLYIFLLHYDFTEEGLSEIAKKVANVRYFCFHSQSSFFKLSKSVFAPSILKNVEILHLKCFRGADVKKEHEALISTLSSLQTLQKIIMLVPFNVTEDHHKALKKALPKLEEFHTVLLEWNRTTPPVPPSTFWGDCPEKYQLKIREINSNLPLVRLTR